MKKLILMLIVLAVVVTTAEATDYSDFVLADANLVAYYQFDEVSGSSTDNAEGTAAYDGILANITLPGESVAGPNESDGFSGLGTANTTFDFNGVDDVEAVVLPTAAQTALDSDVISIAFMFRDDAPGTYKCIFDLGLGAAADNQIILASTTYGGNRRVYVQSDQGSGYGHYMFNSVGILDDGDWHHVVVTRSGITSVNQLAVYVDGVALPYVQLVGGAGATAGVAMIGARTAGEYGVDGGIDEISFYNKALSSVEVQELFLETGGSLPDPDGQFGKTLLGTPVIDGAYDSAWALAKVYTDFYRSNFDDPNNVEDLRIRYCGMWDDDNLYILAEVTDDILNRYDKDGGPFYDDYVVIFTDVHDKNRTYDANDIFASYCAIELTGSNPLDITPAGSDAASGTYKMTVNDNSYVLEASIPWANLGVDDAFTPADQVRIGFDIMVSDSDDPNTRNTQLTWASTWNTLQGSSAQFATVQLLDGTPPQSSCSEQWDNGFGLLYDLNKDCEVDLADFAAVAIKWQDCSTPGDAGCW